MEQRYRANLVNSLSGFKSANLIGTMDSNGKTNLAIFSSVVHLGASPALIGFVMRPDNVPRDTLKNIKDSGAYTINQVNRSIWQKAHQTSARYDENVSEFDAVSLTPLLRSGFVPPFVKESNLQLAVELVEIMPITANNTLFIIGKITDLFLPENAISVDGYLDIEACQSVAISGLDSYHSTKRLARLSYAKPFKEVEQLNVDNSVICSNGEEDLCTYGKC
ncbi:flavin reductase family protein [Thalassotalea ganghwensis]